jgi:hypothetical protein
MRHSLGVNGVWGVPRSGLWRARPSATRILARTVLPSVSSGLRRNDGSGQSTRARLFPWRGPFLASITPIQSASGDVTPHSPGFRFPPEPRVKKVTCPFRHPGASRGPPFVTQAKSGFTSPDRSKSRSASTPFNSGRRGPCATQGEGRPPGTALHTCPEPQVRGGRCTFRALCRWRWEMPCRVVCCAANGAAAEGSGACHGWQPGPLPRGSLLARAGGSPKEAGGGKAAPGLLRILCPLSAWLHLGRGPIERRGPSAAPRGAARG